MNQNLPVALKNGPAGQRINTEIATRELPSITIQDMMNRVMDDNRNDSSSLVNTMERNLDGSGNALYISDGNGNQYPVNPGDKVMQTELLRGIAAGEVEARIRAVELVISKPQTIAYRKNDVPYNSTV
tara:strand:+ start:3578 stop:3961 length:384 start_codon:yes stop_codon:yes gene_type:complete